MPRSISAMLGFAIGVAVGMSFFYPKDLHTASIYGNLEAVRLIVTSSAQEPLVLDRALRISAGLGRLDIAKLLVEHGASDMDGALRQAAVRNQMPIVRWLVAPERSPPATDLARAIRGAGNSGAAEAEFFLLTMQRHYVD